MYVQGKKGVVVVKLWIGIFNIRYHCVKIWTDISDAFKLLRLEHFKEKIKSNIIASY